MTAAVEPEHMDEVNPRNKRAGHYHIIPGNSYIRIWQNHIKGLYHYTAAMKPLFHIGQMT